jgi:uncharacterized membrane protein
MTPDEQIEDPQTEISQLSDHLREYIGIRRELFELKLWDKLFSTASAAITWVIIGLLGIICLFMLSAAAAYLIGVALGKTWLGFLIVGGTYGVIAAVLVIARDSFLLKPLTNKFIDNAVNDDDDDEDDKEEIKNEARADQQQKAA